MSQVDLKGNLNSLINLLIVYLFCDLVVLCTQGSRLTFQLASPVASDRFDSLDKTDFSPARYSDNLK